MQIFYFFLRDYYHIPSKYCQRYTIITTYVFSLHCVLFLIKALSKTYPPLSCLFTALFLPHFCLSGQEPRNHEAQPAQGSIAFGLTDLQFCIRLQL